VDESIFAVIQLLWLNLIMDIFAAAALATDYPTKDLLKRRPEPRNANIISVTMWKMILGQAIYQLAVIFTLHYAGSGFVTTGVETQSQQLQTFVFNTYMFMQLFNQTK
jgi:P-type Ca2+ transporter type 2C